MFMEHEKGHQPKGLKSGRFPERAAYSVKETCELLGLSRSTLYRLIQRRAVRRVHVGRRPLIPAGEIDRLLEPDDAEGLPAS